NALIARHDSMRVTFDPGMTRQRIAPKLEIDVTFVDLTSLDPGEADAALDRERANDVDTPFDLVGGPLVRARLLKRAEDDHHFFLTVHHAVCDGWSSGTLLRRLAELYTAIRRGEDANLPPAMSLAEYVDWFEQYRSSDDYEADKDFWVDYIGTQFPVTDLPADRPRPPVKRTAAERTTRRIDGELLKGLREMAAAEGVTLFTLLLGSFECLLARLTDQDEVGLAVSIAGHVRFANRDLVAHAVNALPLRRPVARDGSFSDHLASTRAAFFDAFDHQDFSYGAIVRHSGAARDPSRTPLVSTTFNMDSPSGQLDMDGATAVPGSNPRRHEIFDAFINIVPHDDHLIIECTYDVALFDRATIDRRLEGWTIFLEGLVEVGPAVPVGQVGMVPATELHLLEQWNSTEADFGPPATIVSLLTETVNARPDSIAVVTDGRSLTYSELERSARTLASRLSRLGVGRGSMVGILCRPSVGMLTGIYGVLMTGAAYVPLDPEFPLERIRYVIDETQMDVVLSQAQLRHLLDDARLTVVDVEEHDFATTPDLEPAAPPEDVSPDDTAYVIYTSGSTGRPKGVMVKHGSVANLLRWMERALDVTTSDRLLVTKTIAFDASIVELFGGVIAGAGLVIPEDRDQTDPALLIQTIVDHDVSILQFVPTMLAVFLQEPRVSECRSVRLVACGGEPLPPELCRRFHDLLDAELANHYGPTENTVDATTFRCEAGDSLRPSIPIGRPIANVRIHILDRALNPLPVGVVGEICIAGAQVAKGYLNRPELTAERFVEEPGTDGEPMYRTGDLGRWLSDGTIEYLGRGDTQVKLRGYRIELGEIEAQLSEHPSVSSAAVVVDGNGPSRRLVAYVAGRNTQVDELRDWLRTRVPPYMVPTAWVNLDKMPTTVGGKVDRRALPTLGAPPNRGSVEFVAPSTPIEEEIAGIWEEVIGIDRVGTRDDFFDLGGHSLTAMQANARLRAAYDVEITLADFRTHSTVGDQALLVTQLLASEQLDDELMAAVLALGSSEDGGSEA
ncbi:MAG TPA: amino acid adenylation domain-containing protein, partial [Acidimicrobiia bacterium]|nr:amino acid adenylation domain-containing protein [Acidimicrobiia bacterium]